MYAGHMDYWPNYMFYVIIYVFIIVKVHFYGEIFPLNSLQTLSVHMYQKQIFDKLSNYPALLKYWMSPMGMMTVFRLSNLFLKSSTCRIWRKNLTAYKCIFISQSNMCDQVMLCDHVKYCCSIVLFFCLFFVIFYVK